MRDQPRQQRGLARPAPACKADDFHSSSVAAHDSVFGWNRRSDPVIASAAKQSRLPPRKDPGLLRCARNDAEAAFTYSRPCLYRLDPNVMLTSPP
ncbi:hypothetical protein DCM78_30970 [Bradyrhizobium sp. WBOS04]|nr:hypothetical protein DCM78_30970 [Bradyrhizobium sp. WBOS04]UUO58317.1 hypothetical protein DCM80_03470 [Bradyrhizobium sp. WBOS08]